MKTPNRIKICWLIPLLTALALFRPLSAFAQDDTDDFSWLKLIPPGYWLDSWSFAETNLVSDFGFSPLSFSNVVQVPDWDGEALQVDTTNAAWLTYNIVEQNLVGYGDYTNLSLNIGSVEFWFLANWQSDDTNFYGSGPGDFGRFIDVGMRATNADSDWWSFYLNPSGTGIYFSSGTNGVRTNYLSAPISWDSSQWHLVVLTFSATSSFIYLDGQLAASGQGVCYVPSGDILTNGFSIGSDLATGLQQAHGQFDDLATYNYQLSAEDISDEYAEVSPELPGSFHPGFGADDSPPLPGSGGGGGTSGGEPALNGGTPSAYGSNLWVSVLGMANNALSLLETNTQADILYELQGCTNLACPVWTSYGFVNGSELTNCTPAIAPVSNEGNMFYRVRSWQGVDGIPYWWFYYFGLTNISGEAFSPSGDGWTLLQCFEDGISPTNFVTPPAPQGLTITSYNTNGTATLSWMLSAGPVMGYILQTPNGTNIVGSGVNNFTDTSSSSSASYSIQAIYTGGNSAWSPSVSVADFENESTSFESANNILSVNLIGGPLGSAYLAVSDMPTNTAALQVTQYDFVASYEYNDYSYNTSFNITVNSPTNGFYSLPNVMTPPDPYVEEYNLNSRYYWYVTALDTNGQPISVSVDAGVNYISEQDNFHNSWVVPPYFDGRKQMKQNLAFLLRVATANAPLQFQYDFSEGSYPLTYTYPANYAYVGFYAFDNGFWDEYYLSDLDVFLPFERNYLYLNFAFNTNDLDENGDTTTGVGGDGGLTLQQPEMYQFQAPVTNGAIIPPVLGTNQAQWLCSYPPANDPSYIGEMGVYSFYETDWETYYNTFYGMSNNIPNLFGLPYTSAMISWSNSADSYIVLPAGGQVENVNGYFYPGTAQPLYQAVGYDFWGNQGYSGNIFIYGNSTLPGATKFTTAYTNSLMIASVGDSGFQVVAYAKLAVTNGNPGIYGYLGQYFTNAYQIDDTGSVTTNLAGMLSPYGDFYPTEPGQAALVTMPDPDTGEQGTGVVDIIALNVDANHDGTMDTSFTGPDFVGPNNPYQFWVNDDQDNGDDGGNGGLQIPGQPNADGIYPSGIDANDQPLYTIHGTRDLVDFFPVYVNIGSLFQSNALSAGISYTDTNWQFVLSQGDGALRFAYTDLTPLNYTNYLRDITTATNLADASAFDIANNPQNVHFLTTVSNTGVALSSSFIANIATNNGGIILVEAWEPTTQPLVLTIYHGTNQIAQTSLSLSISEVEQMFRHKNILLTPQPNQVPDRLTDADVPNEPPTNDKNFIFVHGYNVNVTQAQGWDSDIFKRLYWSGSHAKFYGVTWEAADSQIADSVTVDLQTNIVNAFNTAPLLNTFLNCHRSLQNQPAGVESKPATLRCCIHIRFLDAGKGFSITAGHCLLNLPVGWFRNHLESENIRQCAVK